MARTNSKKALKKIDSDDLTVKQLQDNVGQIDKNLDNFIPLDGVLVKNICLVAGEVNEIHHKLERKPLGWFIVRKRQDSRIWDLQDTNPSPTKTLSIACSHACQIDIWIF